MNDQQLKEMSRTMEQLSLTNQTMVRVKLGVPKNEGVYEIDLYEVALRDGLPDSEIFTKTKVGSLEI